MGLIVTVVMTGKLSPMEPPLETAVAIPCNRIVAMSPPAAAPNKRDTGEDREKVDEDCKLLIRIPFLLTRVRMLNEFNNSGDRDTTLLNKQVTKIKSTMDKEEFMSHFFKIGFSNANVFPFSLDF